MQPHVGQSLSTLPFARPAGRTVPRPAGGRGRVAGTRASLLIAVSAFVLATVLATPGQANAQGTSQQTPQVLVSNLGADHPNGSRLVALRAVRRRGSAPVANAAGYTRDQPSTFCSASGTGAFPPVALRQRLT